MVIGHLDVSPRVQTGGGRQFRVVERKALINQKPSHNHTTSLPARSATPTLATIPEENPR